MSTIHKITPTLWFDNQAEEAAAFYTAIFDNPNLGHKTEYGEAGEEIHGKPKGSAMTVEFEIGGQKFVGLNGGPQFKFNQAVSFVVHCEDQAEVDYYWNSLTAGGGEEGNCGWLKDKFGLSWQIVPNALGELLQGGGKASERVMDALLQMKKLDIETLRKAQAAE